MLYSKRTMAGPGIAAGVLLAALGLSAPAIAQQGDGGGQAPAGQSAQQTQEAGKLVEARLKVRDLREKLSKIRKSALEKNPELQKQREEFRNSVSKAMQSDGVNPEEDVSRLREIAEKLRSGDVQGSEQQQLTQEYQQKRQALLQARRKAMSNEEIRKSQKSLQDNLMEAMKAENSETESLIQEYNKANAELRKRMQAQQPRGGGMGGGSGSGR